MIALTALAAPAHASGDQSFSDGVDWILGLMQGSMGGIIMLIAIISAVLGMLLGGWKGLLTVVGILFGLIILPPRNYAVLFSNHSALIRNGRQEGVMKLYLCENPVRQRTSVKC